MFDPTNIPEDFDWQKAYFELSERYHESLLKKIDLNAEFQELSDKYQIDLSNDALIIAKFKQSAQTLYDALKRWTTLAGDKAPESDLAVLKSFDDLMIEIANSTVSSNQ